MEFHRGRLIDHVHVPAADSSFGRDYNPWTAIKLNFLFPDK